MLVKLPFVLDSDIKKNILDFVLTSDAFYWKENTSGNTFNRKFCMLNKYNLPLTTRIKDYSNNLFSLLNITKQIEEKTFGNFIGVQKEGGFVQPHTDGKNDIGWEHVRVNFLVSKPKEGGMPIISNELYTIDENCSWFNYASKWVHSSTPVFGDTPRIVLSLGAFVSPIELYEAKIY
jgi:hypothetical protein